MKKILILLLVLECTFIYSQTTPEIKIKNSTTNISTIGGNQIVINLSIDFTEKISKNDISEYKDYTIKKSTFFTLNSNLKFQLKTTKYKNLITSTIKYQKVIKDSVLRVKISGISSELTRALTNSDSDFYLTVNKNILLEIWKNNNSNTLVKVQIPKIQIEISTKKDSLKLTESMAQEYIDSRGGEIVMTQNKFDFGMIPKEESSSSKVEFNATFGFRKRYSFLSEKTPIFFTAEGRISTNAKDSLNFVSIYPINYNFSSGKSQFIGQFGIEGNQSFSNYRITANFFWNSIIPNLIDLTLGENRLRLKPVIKIGAKFYQEIENNRPIQINAKEFSNQAFGEIYYYIPVQSIYSLIIEGKIFYDFNKFVNPSGNLKSNYSITFGLEIPKSQLKTIFKYTKGVNGISFEKNDYFIVGLSIDSFGLKK
ncbi:MAG: RNA-binding protein YhbY [Flavobacteriales bacterium]|jgi:RNA-binding protein YhbY